MWTLDAVLNALRHLAGRPKRERSPYEGLNFAEGRSMLVAHTDALLGPAPSHRTVRIMVTMSTEAADDYTLVRDLLSHGMNCMRINCAHDTPETWTRIVAHLKRARRELGLACRIFMDLAGPKLRTGNIEQGPQVILWHPRRDAFGRITEAARIWLVPNDGQRSVAGDADAVLPVPTDWLNQLKLGERIHFQDARAKRRVLEVMGGAGTARWARCSQTAYVTEGTRLVRVKVDANREAQVGALVPRDTRIVLHTGDFLLLTREPAVGKPAEVDSSGRVLRPASISCTLSDVFSRVRVGERIWIDDGKIGGIVRKVEGDVLHIEITQARPKGEKLLADKGINLPDTDINLPGITKKDVEDLRVIVRHADLVGMSFVHSERYS